MLLPLAASSDVETGPPAAVDAPAAGLEVSFSVTRTSPIGGASYSVEGAPGGRPASCGFCRAGGGGGGKLALDDDPSNAPFGGYAGLVPPGTRTSAGGACGALVRSCFSASNRLRISWLMRSWLAI